MKAVSLMTFLESMFGRSKSHPATDGGMKQPHEVLCDTDPVQPDVETPPDEHPPEAPTLPGWAREAVGWKEIAQAFIREQLPQEHPDFDSFTAIAASFSDLERHGAWKMVANQCWPGSRVENQCLIEALRASPEDSPCWWQLKVPEDDPRALALKPRLQEASERISGRRRVSDIAPGLLADLREVFGPPGS